MSLHYLDPDREPRECDGCAGFGRYPKHRESWPDEEEVTR